jgi:hypothetical protein
MLARIPLLSLVFVFAVAASWAQDTTKERVIDLADGGRVVMRADGTMGHYDAAGGPVPMPEGEVMVATDGTRIMMKAEALWRQIIEQATLNFALAATPPWSQRTASERSIELNDGGRIALRPDGTMAHYDAAGNRVSMADGVVMTAKDGTQILMTNGTLWSPNADRPATRPQQ